MSSVSGSFLLNDKRKNPYNKPKDEKIIENLHLKKRIIEIAFIIGFIGLCYYSYKK